MCESLKMLAIIPYLSEKLYKEMDGKLESIHMEEKLNLMK